MFGKLVAFSGVVVLAGALGATASTVGIQVPGISGEPAEWLLTPAERSEITALKTPEEAKQYVELFWARRDPTPGTWRNEFRDVFEARVIAADKYFTQGDVRGATSDRGKVYILLGPPTTMWTEGHGFEGVMNGAASAISRSGGGGGSTDPFSGGSDRMQKGRDSWHYNGADAERFGLHDFEALFLEDSHGVFRRDPSRTMVPAAIAAAQKSFTRNPDLKSVPEWAKAPAPTVTTKVTRVVVPDAPKLAPPPPLELQGANSFALTKSVSLLAPQKSANPFTGLTTTSTFKTNDDLGYAFQYCADSSDPDALPPLKVAVSITGTAKGETVNMNAPAEDALPEALKAMPGCYMIRGTIPLTDMAPGTYTIKVGLEGAKQPYNFSQSFKVE
jgi:GWxTD domain-containing protein